jgi:hypothetical protein
MSRDGSKQVAWQAQPPDAIEVKMADGLQI